MRQYAAMKARLAWLAEFGVENAAFFPPDVEALFLDGDENDENLWELLLEYFDDIAKGEELLFRAFRSSGKRFLDGLARLPQKRSVAGGSKFLEGR